MSMYIIMEVIIFPFPAVTIATAYISFTLYQLAFVCMWEFYFSRAVVALIAWYASFLHTRYSDCSFYDIE